MFLERIAALYSCIDCLIKITFVCGWSVKGLLFESNVECELSVFRVLFIARE